jgi:CheY-like chemotaxis protein
MAISLHILLVDDHADTLGALSKILSRSGHAVSAAPDFETALGVARQTRHELLLADIDLGEQQRGGIELLLEIREMYPIRAIALTGLGMPDEVRRIRAAGFDQHLLKPIDMQQLLSAIETDYAHIIPPPSEAAGTFGAVDV